MPDFPFLNDIAWSDFRNSANYRESFYRLTCAIEDRAPILPGEFKGKLIIPDAPKSLAVVQEKDETDFLESLMEKLRSKQAILLLFQADRQQESLKTHILSEVQEQFSKENILHEVPPFGKNYNFNIIQQDKERFDFNTMADGHSAIINIVTDLIIRMEKHKSKSDDVQGVVLIDESETHLHIALQKKIFRFLTRFFPQGPIYCHKPFPFYTQFH